MKKTFITLILLSIAFAQQNVQYGQKESLLKEDSKTISIAMQSTLTNVPAMEGPINPNTYIVGTGDQLGIDIVSTQNMLFTVSVNPSGDILIPTIGIVPVSGVTLKTAISRVEDSVIKQYRNSKVHVSLVNFRKFLIAIHGAIKRPGFTEVTPVTRLWDAIQLAGGLHTYANEDSVMIINSNGNSKYLSLEKYYYFGDVTENPIIREGDTVIIPFISERKNVTEWPIGRDGLVWVSGYVQTPGTYQYYPGFSPANYFALAGGILASGAELSSYIIRNNEQININGNTIALPGDHIIVPNINEKKDLVWVNGFVTNPMSIPFYKDYTYLDYISSSGGILKSGSESRAYIVRNGKNISCNQNTIVQPGDRIMVPQNFSTKLLGDSNFMQVLTAFTSLYLAYIAATRSI